jgi:hypothetical protein
MQSVDWIYDWVDLKFRSSEFADVDKRLASIDLQKTNMTILLTWLTATFSARSKLPSREAIFNYVDENSHDAARGLK